MEVMRLQATFDKLDNSGRYVTLREPCLFPRFAALGCKGRPYNYMHGETLNYSYNYNNIITFVKIIISLACYFPLNNHDFFCHFHKVVVRGAGHILPHDQPARGYDLITRFISA